MNRRLQAGHLTEAVLAWPFQKHRHKPHAACTLKIKQCWCMAEHAHDACLLLFLLPGGAKLYWLAMNSSLLLNSHAAPTCAHHNKHDP